MTTRRKKDAGPSGKPSQSTPAGKKGAGEVLAIIPVRGGSKGVPRKNAKPLLGVPLVAWSIRQALEAESVSRVVVSTEDEELARIAREYGAEVIERPAELAADTSPTEPALLHVLKTLKVREGYKPEWVVLLQATSPIRTPDLIDRAVKEAREKRHDSLLTVTAMNHFLWRRKGRSSEALYDYLHRPRRQDLKPEDRYFFENGNVYVTRARVLEQTGNRLAGRIGLLETSEEEALEIDTPGDWEAVESALKRSGVWPEWRLPKRIELVIFDFDGVMTNNKVLTDSNGVELAPCDRSDGYGVDLMRAAGVPMMILSTEINPVVAARARKLKIECVQGIADKGKVLRDLFAARNIRPENVIFVGNDINDLPAFAEVGCPVAVSDSHPDVLHRARIILSKPGGDGAVRELCDWILGRLASGKK